MIVKNADILLNDQEINLLADVFLSRYGFDKSSTAYRFIKNAVILFSHGVWTKEQVYALVAKSADVDGDRVTAEIQRAVSSLKKPMHETYNAVYAPPPIEYEKRGDNIKMRDYGKADDALEFLGTAFLYLILTNYNKYEYIDYRPET